MSQFETPNWHETSEGDILPPVIEPTVSQRQLHINHAELRADHTELASVNHEPTPEDYAKTESTVRRHPSTGRTTQAPAAGPVRGESESEWERIDTKPFRENIPTAEAAQIARGGLRLVRGKSSK